MVLNKFGFVKKIGFKKGNFFICLKWAQGYWHIFTSVVATGMIVNHIEIDENFKFVSHLIGKYFYLMKHAVRFVFLM
jgi:hypothetical protein